MRIAIGYTALAVAALVISGCGGGSSGAAPSPAPPPVAAPPPPAPTTTAFTPFVKEQIARRDDAAAPVDVNEQEWVFDEDETAYDDVLEAVGT